MADLESALQDYPSTLQLSRSVVYRGIEKSVSFTEVDILAADEAPGKYDMVVISEVLEHLERPEQALSFLNSALNPGGLIYVNVPINSPSPDHIYLLEHPAAGFALIEAARFHAVSKERQATERKVIEKALSDQSTFHERRRQDSLEQANAVARSSRNTVEKRLISCSSIPLSSSSVFSL